MCVLAVRGSGPRQTCSEANTYMALEPHLTHAHPTAPPHSRLTCPSSPSSSRTACVLQPTFLNSSQMLLLSMATVSAADSYLRSNRPGCTSKWG